MSLQCDNLSGELQDQWSSSSKISINTYYFGFWIHKEIKRLNSRPLKIVCQRPMCRAVNSAVSLSLNHLTAVFGVGLSPSLAICDTSQVCQMVFSSPVRKYRKSYCNHPGINVGVGIGVGQIVKFLVNVFTSLYLLNLLMDQVDVDIYLKLYAEPSGPTWVTLRSRSLTKKKFCV